MTTGQKKMRIKEKMFDTILSDLFIFYFSN